MSLRYALLGLLEDGPASGYELTRRFELSLRKYAWTAQQSHIYPELNKLAAEELISVVDEGARGRRTYAITPAGRDELRAWLTSPMKPRAIRDEQMLRMCLLSALETADAQALVQQYAEQAQRELTTLQSIIEAADAQAHPRGGLRFGRLAADLGVRQYTALLEWAVWACRQLDEAEHRS
ncbi:PadR family transcriptional regulator [Nocardia cyriacigeorgica]|uniref:PadR family transcriptional regulator n=1 Tax=Nocardia cyriacigeorgica TaxID=135487 RepID=UPI00189455F5|nr:PadR family transcriptional regulator [Nocardia cyriacigeorgica]MBF6413880.1 PadR family transcriptional regulator [Nocardia cyriacigeorgica]